MTRLTFDERTAIQLELDDARREILRLGDEITRLQSMLDAQPAGSDGDTIRMLQPLCDCGLPRDHRNPGRGGEPRPCADETARIALVGETRSRPPVPGSVTRDETFEEGRLRYCCAAGYLSYPDPCFDHGAQA
jgi:hypothetical protein